MLNDPQRIRVSRQALSDIVWSEPDVALAKICRKLDIPYPGRGYWRRIQTGKAVKHLALPWQTVRNDS
jgi:hypothetical protein